MRGLKQLTKAQADYTSESHLLQMRGLKLMKERLRKPLLSSHLLQMRGLKLLILLSCPMISVASFTDAWIETSTKGQVFKKLEVASFTDAWIETQLN